MSAAGFACKRSGTVLGMSGLTGLLSSNSVSLIKTNGKKAFHIHTLAQGHDFSLSQCAMEKFKGDIEKFHSELISDLRRAREERMKVIDKMHSGILSDLRSMTDELVDFAKKKNSELRYAMNKATAEQIAQLEKAKYDIIKYCVGIYVPIFAVLAIVGTASAK